MTIFDVLRYPISEVPTLEELEALPGELFNRWVKKQWDYEPALCPPHMIANWADVRRGRPDTIEALSLLRRLIRDYNPR
jgi:hypothetical protein